MLDPREVSNGFAVDLEPLGVSFLHVEPICNPFWINELYNIYKYMYVGMS